MIIFLKDFINESELCALKLRAVKSQKLIRYNPFVDCYAANENNKLKINF